MRPSLDLANTLGYAALLATLLLSGPGVKLVRADEPLMSTVPIVRDGPVCSAQQPIDDRRLAEVFHALRQEVAPADQAPDPNLPVALNNRGYNYGPGPDEGLAAIRAQLGAALRKP